jgi:hypothetical protein
MGREVFQDVRFRPKAVTRGRPLFQFVDILTTRAIVTKEAGSRPAP